MQNNPTPDGSAPSRELDSIIESTARRLMALSPKLINVARKRYRLSVHDANDAVQEAWLRCQNNPHRLSQANCIDSWLIKTFDFSCRTIVAAQSRSVITVLSDVSAVIDSNGKKPQPLDTMLFNSGYHTGPRTSADYHAVWQAGLIY